jgi:hypothetical protein
MDLTFMTLVWVCLDLAVLDVISIIEIDEIDARATVSFHLCLKLTFTSEPICLGGSRMGRRSIFT